MNLSALELHNLVNELGILKDAKVSKIFQPKKKEILFQLHIKEKKILRINVPDYIFLTDFKEDQPSKPSTFCMILRKHLINSIIKKIEQKDFERVLEIIFQTKQENFVLIVELFSKGNIVLCKGNYEIIAPLEKQLWKARKIMRNELYKFPVRKYNFLKLTKKQLEELLETSDRENIVKTLAMELGLGGEYAEELCLMAKINKTKKKLDKKEIDILFKSAVKLSKKKISNVNKKFNDYFSKNIQKDVMAKKTDVYENKVEEMKRVIKMQEKQIENLKKTIEENKVKAQFIYENYTEVNSLLEKIKQLREKHSWKQIKEKIKQIEEINEKEAKVIVELE